MSDAINPDHYKRLPAEAIEIIEAAIDNAPSVQAAYLHGQALKYLLRCWHKNGIEDLRKAKWYLDRLIESFDESEPEQPKPTLNSDNIPDGYRKLNDSSEEPRQRGDLRWSIAEKRYIEIGFDEIGYANRENWAACRKITGEATGEVKPPDGWRFLEHGEVIRKGDAYLIDGRAVNYPTDYASFGQPYDTKLNSNVIRRNRFERGERVVNTKIDECIFYKVNKHIDDRLVLCFADRNPFMFSKDELAPYIEDTSPEVTGEVAGEVKNPLGCPDGWRWLEVGETLRNGDTTNTIEPIPEHWVGTQCVVKHVALRRNRFKVGEKVVTVLDEFEFVIIDKHSRFNDVYVARNKMTGKIHNIQDRLLAPYIEETK